MIETLYHLSPYAPVVIFTASVLDIFFVTGFILYGAAMMGSVAMMYTTGMITIEGIIIASYLGTLLGNTVNFAVGRLFGKTAFIIKRLEQPRIQKAQGFLRTNGLFLYILVCRFIAIVRPLYAVVLGSMQIKFYRFILYELIVALLWVIFWLIILIQGESLYSHFFGK